MRHAVGADRVSAYAEASVGPDTQAAARTHGMETAAALCPDFDFYAEYHASIFSLYPEFWVALVVFAVAAACAYAGRWFNGKWTRY